MNLFRFQSLCIAAIIIVLVSACTGDRIPGTSAMHPKAQIDFVKRQLEQDKAPFTAAFGILTEKADAAFGTSHHAVEDFAVPGFYQDKENHRRLSLGLQTDAIGAYSCALVWALTGQSRYADRALYFLKGWATVNKRYSEMDGSLVMSYSGTALLFAANLLKDYEEWNAEDRQQFEWWTRHVFRDAANSIRFRNNNSGDWSRFASLLADVYLEDTADFEENIRLIKSDLFEKIATDGHLVEEVKREKNGIWYTHFSLAPLTASMWVIYNHTGENLFFLEKDGASVNKALDYLLYYNRHPQEWPFFKGPATGHADSRYGFWPANLLEAMRPVYRSTAYETFVAPYRPLVYAAHDFAWVFPSLMPLSLDGYP
ncbi:alginate lyase family protein [Sinomicrobium oceani]|uniref:alginate lyase family protein n=1 Tax=Sinomicrobium oceani TaxID=1150368 RepID=UPI00227A5A1F|nr:alginate lyase family protein [Sinomicrobium oceani]